MDYAKKVTQTANMPLASQVVSRASQESTMSYAPIELIIIEIAVEYVSVPHIQSMENTPARPILESLATPYQENHPMDPNLWNSSFALISIFRVDQYIEDDAQNIICSLYQIVLFIKQ